MKKTIGIIGGMGPQASLHFYKNCIEVSQKKYDAIENQDYPHLLISNLPVPDFIAVRSKEELAVSLVVKEIVRLRDAGAQRIVVTCNTMHLYEDRFRSAFPEGFISLIDVVTEEILKSKPQRVGILGTLTTIRTGLYENRLVKSGVPVIVPSELERVCVAEAILKVISGTFSLADHEKVISVIDRMKKDGADSILLGCTELPLILNPSETPQNLRLFDCLSLLAEKVCDFAYRS